MIDETVYEQDENQWNIEQLMELSFPYYTEASFDILVKKLN